MAEKTPTRSTQNNFQWKTIITWVVLAILLRWQVIEPRWIPSGSMLPTLQIQDRILIEKIRPRILKKQNKSIKNESIVVFKPPKALIEAGYDSKSALIKRVIGIEGDEIEVKKGRLIRNGTVIEESWIEFPMEYEISPFIVPNDEIWVLGDNRNNSLDSHIWGGLPEENVIGTAVWRYWPINRFGSIRFPTPERIGTRDLSTIR